MTVCGQYKATFREATHCLFDGHLDDPDFRAIAIQRITARSGDLVTLDRSGKRKVRLKDGKEYVAITYHSLFGKRRATGHPFKDTAAELMAQNEVVEGNLRNL